MATVFLQTPDRANGTTGDQDTTLIDSYAQAGTGTVAYDTGTVLVTGKGSWKANLGATPTTAQAYLLWTPLADAGRRCSWMSQFSDNIVGMGQVAILANLAVSQSCVLLFNAGVLQYSATGGVVKNGTTVVSTGVPHRISVSFVITSISDYTIKVWLDGKLEITVTQADGNLAAASLAYLGIGFIGTLGTIANATHHFAHVYVDDSTALTDVGNMRVTAKRPNANGTANAFTTAIGAGGSGYGSGHSPQVNERLRSDTNGWQSPVTAGTKTEDYAIEGAATGDANHSNDTLVAYQGWCQSALIGAGADPTRNLLTNNVAAALGTVAASTAYVGVIVDSAVYPATGSVIGMNHNGTGKATAIYECGIVMAFSPTAARKPAITLQAVHRAATY